MVARPFFMTLPGYPGRMDEKEILNDLEYLQQTYPGEVRRCQRRIAEILDKYDYEGSMIYDEYPDRFSLYRIADTIGKILERLKTRNDCIFIAKRKHLCYNEHCEFIRHEAYGSRINYGRIENTFTENFE